MRENREILCSPAEAERDASGRPEGRTPMMNGQRKSDRLVVPTYEFAVPRPHEGAGLSQLREEAVVSLGEWEA